MKIGIKTGQGGYSYEELSQVWQKAEELGFDSAWLYDHFLALGDSEADCLEAYTTLSALARDTKRIRLGVMVTCAGYRNPAYLAKVASTVDVISKGRLTMGLGAGWYEEEYKSYGYQYLPAPERVAQMRETIQVLRSMWSDGRGSFKGKYYAIEGAINSPKPLQNHIPIWIGITEGTKTMPRIAVRDADGFNTTANLDVCRQIIEQAERTRREEGRNREELTYSTQKFMLTGSRKQIHEIVKQPAAEEGISSKEHIDSLKERWIVGTPEECADKLRAYTQSGIDYLVLAVMGDTLGWPLELVKDELVPLL